MVREIEYKRNDNSINVDIDKYIEIDQWRKFCQDIEKERYVEELFLVSELSLLDPLKEIKRIESQNAILKSQSTRDKGQKSILKGRTGIIQKKIIGRPFHLRNSKESLEMLSKSLETIIKENSNCLKVLRIAGLMIDEALAETIADALSHVAKFKSLELSRTSLGDKGLKKLAKCFKQCPKLESIGLHSSRISKDGLASLCQVLKSKAIIAVSESWKNGLRYADAISSNTEGYIHRLGLASNHLKDADMHEFLEFLNEDYGLKEIDLRYNQLSPNILTRITNTLKVNLNLQQIDARENRIDNEIVMFAHQQALKSLDITAKGHEMDKIIVRSGAHRRGSTAAPKSYTQVDMKIEPVDTINGQLIYDPSYPITYVHSNPDQTRKNSTVMIKDSFPTDSYLSNYQKRKSSVGFGRLQRLNSIRQTKEPLPYMSEQKRLLIERNSIGLQVDSPMETKIRLKSTPKTNKRLSISVPTTSPQKSEIKLKQKCEDKLVENLNEKETNSKDTQKKEVDTNFDFMIDLLEKSVLGLASIMDTLETHRTKISNLK